MRRGYDSCVIHVLFYLNMVGVCRYLFTYRPNSTGETSPPWAIPVPMLHVVVSSQGRMRWFSPCTKRSSEPLDCKRGLWPTLCQRLWPHPRKLHLLATSHKNFCWLFQQGGSAAATCYVLVWTQTARHAAACTRLPHVGPWWVGSSRTEFLNLWYAYHWWYASQCWMVYELSMKIKK